MKILIFWNNPAPSLFSFHRPLTTCQVSEKNNEQILRKLCCKRMDGRMNMTEFIWPSPIIRRSNIDQYVYIWHLDTLCIHSFFIQLEPKFIGNNTCETNSICCLCKFKGNTFVYFPLATLPWNPGLWLWIFE